MSGPHPPKTKPAEKRRLLWIGDAVAATGFAKATHYILEELQHSWDVHVLGINYRGEVPGVSRHKYPYPIYPATIKGGDLFGVRSTGSVVTTLKPDVVVLLNDPWNIPQYLKMTGNANVIAYCAVDGGNCRGSMLNGVAAALFWTEYALNEAQAGGYRGPAGIVPLGVDLDIYRPQDKAVARERIGLPPKLADAFIVGNVNRNQPRKRLDLTMMWFAEWIRENEIGDAYLYLHVAPTGEQGYDVDQLAQYLGIVNRVIVPDIAIGPGIPEELLVSTYNSFDVQVTTTQGEGFGLTTLEGQACGVPQIVPDWSALGEICADSAMLVPCTTLACTPNAINVIGGIPDREEWIGCLDRVYRDKALRADLRDRGIENAAKGCYRWPNIGAQFDKLVTDALNPAGRLNRA